MIVNPRKYDINDTLVITKHLIPKIKLKLSSGTTVILLIRKMQILDLEFQYKVIIQFKFFLVP